MIEPTEHMPTTPESGNSFPLSELSEIVAAAHELSAESGDQIDSRETISSKLNVEFIYVKHTAEHADEIAKALADKELILHELVAHTQKVAELEHSINHVLSTDFAGTFNIDLGEESQPYIHGLLDHLRSTGKEIMLIDVQEDDPGFKVLDQSELKAGEELIDALTDSVPVSKMREAYQAYVTAEGKTLKYRDDFLTDQLDAIFKRLQESGDSRKIAVVQGAGHTRSSHHFRSDDTATFTRQFIGVEGSNPREKMLMTYHDQIIRQRSIDPQKEFPDELIDRGLLEIYCYNALPKDFKDTDIREWIQTLQDEQVTEVLAKINQLTTKNYTVRSLGSKESRARHRKNAMEHYLVSIVGTK